MEAYSKTTQNKVSVNELCVNPGYQVQYNNAFCLCYQNLMKTWYSER